jgi:hypothetical protein
MPAVGAGSRHKTVVHAKVTRANGTVENRPYIVGGGVKGALVRFWRWIRGV